MTTSPVTTMNPFVHATPVANASDGNQNSSSQPAGITANDFLTLLVTEMKNQDPTAQTDPNEYINQLVQVNSLEQLIDINQNLSSALGDSNAGAGTADSALAKPAGVAGVTGPTSDVPVLSGFRKSGGQQPCGRRLEKSSSDYAGKSGHPGCRPGGPAHRACIERPQVVPSPG